MHTPSTRTLTTLLPHLRSLHTTIPILQKGPPTTQGHASIDGKSGLDVQSHQAQAGKSTRAAAQNASTSDGNDQPFDAASQGSAGGVAKGDGKHKGPWKSQVGGQDDPEKGEGVVSGGQESVATGKVGETVEMVKGLFGARKFSTYSRALYPATTTTASESNPPPPSSETDQNSHLKHTKGGADGVSPTGNASADPSLPSKSKSTTSTSSPTSKRSFSTSRITAYPADPTGTANSQGDAAKKPLDKQSSSPLGEKGGNAGTPQTNSGETQASKDMPTGTNAPDPGIKQSESEAPSKGMLSGGDKAVRRYSTFTRSFSTSTSMRFPTDPTGTANSQGDAAKKPMDKQSASPLGEKGGNAGTPQTNSGETQASKDMPTGTNAPDPGIKQSESEAASKGMLSGGDKAVRRYSTVSALGLVLGMGRRGVRGYAANPPGGYAKAHKGEGADQGYQTPSEALPQNLDSAYANQDAKAAPPVEGDLKPSSELEHSSSAVLPPNPALKKMAMEGTRGEENPPPSAKVGEIGLDEAWKHRK